MLYKYMDGLQEFLLMSMQVVLGKRMLTGLLKLHCIFQRGFMSLYAYLGNRFNHTSKNY